MNSSFASEGLRSVGSSGAKDLHVSGRNRGIREIDLHFALGETGAGGAADDSGISEENAVLLAAVTSLDLSRNEIEYLSNLDPLCSLKKLNASYNLISAVHGLPFKLTRLNLSHNRLRDLDGIASLPHLKELDVSANRLPNLAGLSARMPLRILRADDNRLVSTLGLEDMPSLRVLSLANNYIERLDELAFLSNAVSLQSLSLRNNPVTLVTGYRLLVAQRQAALLSLDGAPLLRPRREEDYLHHGGTGSRGAGVAMPTARAAGDASSTPATSSMPAARHTDTSAAASVYVTPVRAVRSAGAHLTADSPMFDDSFMQQMYGKARSGGGDGDNTGRPPVASEQQIQWSADDDLAGGAIPPQAIGGNTSGKSDHTPVAARAAPLPTSRKEDVSVGTARAETSGPRRGYAQLFQEMAIAKQGQPSPSKSNMVEQSSTKVPDTGVTLARTEETLSPSPGMRRQRIGMSRLRQQQSTNRSAAQSDYPSPSTIVVASGTAESPEQQRSAVARLHDCLVAKEQLEKENRQLKARLRKCEEQLADSRRIVSEQLGDLSTTRVERDALRQSEGDLKERLDRSRRHVKAMEAHHKEEINALQQQFARASAFHDAQLADLRRQLAAEMARSATSTSSAKQPVAEATSTDGGVSGAVEVRNASGATAPLPLEQRLSEVLLQHQARLNEPKPLADRLPPFPQTPASTCTPAQRPTRPVGVVSNDSEWVGAVPTRDLADQLKGWLYSQMAEDMDKAEQEELHEKLLRSLEAEDANDRSNAVRAASERARELLEAYVLGQQQQQLPEHQQHAEQQQQQRPSSPTATGSEGDGEAASVTTSAGPRGHPVAEADVSPSPYPNRPAGLAVNTAQPGGQQHEQVEEVVEEVSRRRPSLSPQKER